MKAFQIALLAAALVMTALPSRGQIEVTADPTELPVSVNREDVKAIGMGRTQIANGSTFNAMMYNPAFLARTATRVDILTVGADLPKDTPDAIAFLRDEYKQFKGGQFLKDINAGAKELQNWFNGVPGADQAHALALLNSGLNFTRQFQQKLVGTEAKPLVHGAAIIPSIQVQVGNFGFSLYGIAQAAFTSFPTRTTDLLYSLRLPSTLDNLTEQDVVNLIDIVGGLFDPVTLELSKQGAIPLTYAVGYFDIVGAAGYGSQLTPELNVGGALKVVNRRFSNKIISADNYSSILTELRKEFNASATGVTVDLGATYHVRKTGLDLGVSLQNVIPMKKLTSNLDLKTVIYDSAGNPYDVRVKAPFELTLPFLANLGANYRITRSWDASLDWIDIAAQDDKFEHYFDRFRVGTEYRLDAIREKLGIVLRAGFATARPTVGLGLNIFNIVQLDGAYAYDHFFGDYAWYGQLRIGW